MGSISSPSPGRAQGQSSKESDRLDYIQQLRENLSTIENTINDIKQHRREMKELELIQRSSFLTADVSLNEQIVSKLQELSKYEAPFIQDISDISVIST
jgi:hypothetical protein